MSSFTNLSTALTTTLKDSDLQGVTTEFSEIFLDTFLAEGVLKDIPIINTIISLGKTGIKINDALFLKKVMYFLTQVNDIPIQEREEVINSIDESKNYRIKIGEKLLYIIDKCDDHDKAQFVGLLFKTFLQKKIDYDEFLLCNLVLEKCIIGELEVFALDECTEYTVEEHSEYLNWGLVNFSPYKINIEQNSNHKGELELELHGNDFKLDTSYAGGTLREILKKHVRDIALGAKFYNLPKREIQENLVRVLSKYSLGNTFPMLAQVSYLCVAQLCNNKNITDEEFEEFANYIIANFKHLPYYERYLSRYNGRMEMQNISFDYKRWDRYYKKYFIMG